MDIWGWLSGVSQKVAADQLKPYLEKYGPYVGGTVMSWLRSRGWRWVMWLFYGMVTAACLQILLGSVSQEGKNPVVAAPVESTSSVSPCTVPLRAKIVEYEKLQNTLKNIVPPPCHVRVVVEDEKYKNCPYAEALFAVLQGAWGKNVELIYQSELGRDGLWIESDPHDATEVVQIYEELDQFPSQPPQEVHYWGRPGAYPPGTWAFYVKDTWSKHTP